MAEKAIRRIRTKNGIEESAKLHMAPRETSVKVIEEGTVEDVTELEIQRLIDDATEWDGEQKELAKKVTKAKKLLLDHAKETRWKERAGESGTCQIGPSSKTTILATALAKVLKKMGKTALFDDLSSVRLGEAKKYIGEQALEDISSVETTEYGTVSLKPLKK